MGRFRIGQKVVCVDAPDYPLYQGWRAYPKQGVVYTVRGYRRDDLCSLMLFEIVNDLDSSGNESAYFEERFRPVVTRDTDISVFTEMLIKASERI